MHRILEIEHARIGPGADHQVAGVIIAVHEHARLLQSGRDQAIEDSGQQAALRIVELQAEVPAEQPVREQAHLEAQQLLVVRWQLAGVASASGLDPDQRVDRVVVEVSGAVAVRELGKIGGRAEVGQQQETVGGVARQHPRRIDTDVCQHARNLQVRLHVLPVWRSVHRDVRAIGPRDAEIAPETRIGGCRGEAGVGPAEPVLEPVAQ